MTADRARTGWYRTTAWDAAAQEDFEDRSQRTWAHDRSQYPGTEGCQR